MFPSSKWYAFLKKTYVNKESTLPCGVWHLTMENEREDQIT